MDVGLTIGDEPSRIDEFGDRFAFVELGIGEGELPDTRRITTALASADVDVCVHLPFSQDLVTPVEEINDGIRTFLVRLLDWAGELGAEKAVLHATARNPHAVSLRDPFVAQLEALGATAADHGIELVLENVGHQARGFPLSVVGKLAAEADVAVCFDVGHAFMEDGQDAIDRFLGNHRDRISHLHIHDVRQRGDTHLPIGAGEIDYDAVADALGSFDGTVAVEVFTDDRPLLIDSATRIKRHLGADE